MNTIENETLKDMLDLYFEKPNAEDPFVMKYSADKLESVATIHRNIGRVVIPAMEGPGEGVVVGYHTFYPVPSGTPFASWGYKNQKAMKLLLQKE